MHWQHTLGGESAELLNQSKFRRKLLAMLHSWLRLSRGVASSALQCVVFMGHETVSCCRLLGLPRAAWRTTPCLRLSRKVANTRPCLLRCQRVACTWRQACSRRVSPAAWAWLRLAVGRAPSAQLQSRGWLAGMDRPRCERPTPSGQAPPQHQLQLVQRHHDPCVNSSVLQIYLLKSVQRPWFWHPSS